jgi:hypothetical protein
MNVTDRLKNDRTMMLIIGVIAAVCFANALNNSFTLDDQGIILENTLVHSASGIWRAFAHPYWPEYEGAGQYRPLVIASYALDWALSGGGWKAAWWFHLVNVAWHVAACVLVYRLLKELASPIAAAAGAIIFAVHPVHVEAVSNLVGRAELMMTVFALLAIIAHRRGSWWAVVWFTLALFSKESGITVIGIALASDVLMTPDWRKALKAHARLYAGYIGVCVLYAVVVVLIFRHQSIMVIAPTWKGASTNERLLTMLGVVPQYLRLMVAPWDLDADYTPRTIDLEVSVTWGVIMGVLLLAVWVGAALAAWKKAPLVTFGIALFVAAIAPVANVFFPAGIVLAERTLYLPSVGAMCVLAWLIDQADAVGARRVLPLAGAALAIAFAVRTWTRTPVWRSNKSLALAWLEEHPESYRAHAWAASAFSYGLDWESAARQARISRALFPLDAIPYVTGGEAALGLNQPAVAAALFDSALGLDPKMYPAVRGLAKARYMAGDNQGAIDASWRAYKLYDTAPAFVVLFAAAERTGNYAAADSAFRRGLADHPNDVSLRRGYAGMLRAKGDTAGARVQLEHLSPSAMQGLLAAPVKH